MAAAERLIRLADKLDPHAVTKWIHTDPETLHGTGYFEIQPGPYAQKHWQPGCLFLDEERFGYIEPIFKNRVQAYDNYSMVEITREQWQDVLSDLSDLAEFLSKQPEEQALRSRVGFFFSRSENEFFDELDCNVQQLREMVCFIRDWVATTLETHDTVSALGL